MSTIDLGTTATIIQEGILNRPVSHTIRRLIKGALVVDTTTFIGGLSATSSPLPSMLGCFIGLAIVRAWIFDKADVLEQKRWLPYWHGDLLGYWLSYLPLTVVMASGGGSSQDDFVASSLVAYVGAPLVGFFVGWLNVRRTDDKDKRQIAEQLLAPRVGSAS